MIKTVRKKDLFGNVYEEKVEIYTDFPWARDYEEDETWRVCD